MSSEENYSRPTSQSSTRKRWETHCKGSFEGCLAVESPSPVNKHTNNKKLLSTKKKSVSDSSFIYDNSSNDSNKPSRVKSAVKKGNRETEAELKHALKMAEGRRARGSSASSDKQLLKEVNTSAPSAENTRIPSAVKRVTKRSNELLQDPSLEKDYGNNMRFSPDNSLSDSLSVKHSMILNNLSNSSKTLSKNVRNSMPQSSSVATTESKEDGYGSDDSRGTKIISVNRKASAPPLESSENDVSSSNGANGQKEKVSKQSSGKKRSVSSAIKIAKNNEYSTSTENTPSKYQKDKKKKRKSTTETNSNNSIGEQLRKLRDDIVDFSYLDDGQFGGGSGGPPDFIAMPGLIVTNQKTVAADEGSHEKPVNTIHTQNFNGFILSKDGKKYIKQKHNNFESEEERMLRQTVPPSRATLALLLQTSFRTFAVCCQGLLAGLSIAHCLMVFLLADSWTHIAEAFPPRLAHVLYALIVFITFIVFVASCDRCDVCSSDGGLLTRHSLHIPWSAGLYFMSLCITVASSRTEITLAHRHVELPTPHQTGGIGWYAWLSLARTVTNTLAWVAVVPDPHTDNLLNKLHVVVKEEGERAMKKRLRKC